VRGVNGDRSAMVLLHAGLRTVIFSDMRILR
jgi:hypothetical protein